MGQVRAMALNFRKPISYRESRQQASPQRGKREEVDSLGDDVRLGRLQKKFPMTIALSGAEGCAQSLRLKFVFILGVFVLVDFTVT
jgi:hypothetical protein